MHFIYFSMSCCSGRQSCKYYFSSTELKLNLHPNPHVCVFIPCFPLLVAYPFFFRGVTLWSEIEYSGYVCVSHDNPLAGSQLIIKICTDFRIWHEYGAVLSIKHCAYAAWTVMPNSKRNVIVFHAPDCIFSLNVLPTR